MEGRSPQHVRAPLWHELRRSPLLPWVLLFLFVSLLVTQRNLTNPMARIAALRAATDGRMLHIDRYKDWTIDWALSPNGHYYQNKAPGSIFLGLPVFAVTDLVERHTGADRRDAAGRLPEPGYLTHIALVLTVQLLPFSLLVLLVGRELAARGVSHTAQHVFALAALFGNTASILMNSYFGHGLAAVLFLAAFLFWLQRRWALAGLCVSWCVLSEYGGLFVLPAFVMATMYRERNLRWATPVVLGALPATAIWCWYHTVTFGSPFSIASVYTNPKEIYQVPERHNLWGTFSFLPYPEFVGALLFGPSRGILFTQPWVLMLIGCTFFVRRHRELVAAALFSVLALAGLVWLNGGFGGWHAGWTIGPRYLSLAFPALALLVALLWDRLPRYARVSLASGLAVSLVFRWLILPFPVIMPVKPLWPYAWQLFGRSNTLAPYAYLVVSALAAALTTWVVLRTRRSDSPPVPLHMATMRPQER
jgi:hypothetical protein